MSIFGNLIHALAGKFRLQRCARRVGSQAWARQLAAHGLPQFPAQALSSGRLVLPDLAIEISSGHNFVLGAYGYLWDIKACGFSLNAIGEREIEIAGHGVRVRLNSVEEVFIFREIFCERTYDVQPAVQALVIDVGMNIGLASLFFAASLPNSRVEAFEPFASTCARARQQLALNPELAGRINVRNYGLWSANEHRRIEIDASHKGSTGIWGTQADLDSGTQRVRDSEEIMLCDAAAVLGPILSAHRSGPIILKLDAEGSEYGIFEQLAKAELVGRFDVILMEWHRIKPEHDPLRIRAMLSDLGYCSLCHQYLHRPFGMLYAFRQCPSGRV